MWLKTQAQYWLSPQKVCETLGKGPWAMPRLPSPKGDTQGLARQNLDQPDLVLARAGSMWEAGLEASRGSFPPIFPPFTFASFSSSGFEWICGMARTEPSLLTSTLSSVKIKKPL